MAKGIALTEQEIMQRRREISGAALSLFRTVGFQKTSMREIAVQENMGKSSLYDFFKTKDEIVVFIFEEEMREVLEEVSSIIGLKLAPEQCLVKMMECNLKFTQENGGLSLWIRSEERFLEDEYQNRIQKMRHEYQDIFKSVIEQGIAEGAFRETDAALAARLLINSMLSVAYTTRPADNTEDMLAMSLDLFFHGLVRTDGCETKA